MAINPEWVPYMNLTSPSIFAYPLWVQIVLGVIAGGLTLVTILGNVTVLYAFARTRRLHTYANYYIISLASVDLFLGIVSSPVYGALFSLGYWPFGDTLCFVIYQILTFSAFHTSYLSTLAIALDRYFSIAYPLKHLTYRTTKVASFVIFLVYFIPVVLWWPFNTYWRWFYDGDFPIFPFLCIIRVTSSIYATMFVICVYTWLPILTMVIVYVKVYRIARDSQINKRSLRSIHESPREAATSSRTCDVNTIQVDLQPSQSEARVNPAFTVEDESPYDDVLDRGPEVLAPKRTKPGGESGDGGMASAIKQVSSKNKKTGSKALRTLTPIFISMMVSGVPWAILVIVFVVCPLCVPKIVNQTAIYLTRACSAMNPFCYAIANPLYRQGVLSLIFTKKKKRGP